MSLLLLFGGYAPPAPDHWRDVREGDILQVLLPYAGFRAVCVLVRVIKRVYSDAGDGLLELEVQLLPPHAPGDNLTFVADTGPIPGPKPIVPSAIDVPAQIAQTNEQVAKLKSDVGIIQATS